MHLKGNLRSVLITLEHPLFAVSENENAVQLSDGQVVLRDSSVGTSCICVVTKCAVFRDARAKFFNVAMLCSGASSHVPNKCKLN